MTFGLSFASVDSPTCVSSFSGELLQTLLILLTVSALLFAIFDSEQFRKKIAVAELGNFGVATLSDDDYQAWLDKKRLNQSILTRYVEWLRDVAHGDLGLSIEKDIAVSTLLEESLSNTAVLAFFVFLIMIPVSLTLGVLAGMNEGSTRDRTISFIAVFTTSIPQIATAALRFVHHFSHRRDCGASHVHRRRNRGPSRGFGSDCRLSTRQFQLCALP
jgi:ABC-type dipeptide/oligopeptide/nickel transport system permease component